MAVTVFNDAQLEVLRMMSVFNTPEAVKDLKQSISNYFVKKAESEIDKLWADGILTESKVEEFRTLHERHLISRLRVGKQFSCYCFLMALMYWSRPEGQPLMLWNCWALPRLWKATAPCSWLLSMNG